MRPLLLSLLALLALPPAVVRAQSYEELATRYSQPRAYHEAVALPAGKRAALLVSFRLPNALLVFVRNRRETPGRAFLAEPRVTAQVFRGKKPVAEQVWQQTHYAATFEQTQRRDHDLQGMLRFDLPPGDYTYRLGLQDGQTGREGASESRAVTVSDFSTLRVGAPLLVRRLDVGAADVALDPVNLSGDAPFGEDAWAVLPLTVPDGLPAGAALRYTLRRLDDPEADRGPVVHQGVVDAGAWMPMRSAQDAVLGEGTLRWPLARPPEAATAFLAAIDLHGAVLDDGAYLLEATLSAGDADAPASARFSTHWRNMPYSLYAPDVAIRNLRFVEDKQTLKALRTGGGKAQEAQIRAYWKQHDPTPETPFNELMAEYYRRVDHAAFAFRTGLSPEPDGMRTDRAAVYVAHGKPERVERAFPLGGGVEETWRYADGRRFVFRAATSLDPPQLQQAIDEGQ